MNNFSSDILRDYSIMDNLEMRSEPDSSYRITTNYSKITCNVYAQPIDNLAKTYHLKELVKRHNERVSSLKINGFRGLLSCDPSPSASSHWWSLVCQC